MRRATILLLLCLAGCGGASKAPAPAKTAPPDVVLGQFGFVTGAVGWGDPHPVQLNVGGDPALVIHRIRWQGWGSPRARGVGRASAFNYHGGSSYLHQVRVELRAYELGRCGGARAYRNLRLRMPEKPGAPMGQWFVLGGGANGLCRRG